MLIREGGGRGVGEEGGGGGGWLWEGDEKFGKSFYVKHLSTKNLKLEFSPNQLSGPLNLPQIKKNSLFLRIVIF